MDEIIQGVHTFQRDVFPEYRELFADLVAGQVPEALLITCSDSRIDPYLLTQSRPGQLFVVRNAGNLVPPYGTAGDGVGPAVEFAVTGLRVPNIIVCGHSECGAMTGLLEPKRVRGMPQVARWLRYAGVVRDSLMEAGQLDDPDALQRAVEANVIAQLGHLRTHPAVATAEAAGRLELHGWVYHLATGEVTKYEPAGHEFVGL